MIAKLILPTVVVTIAMSGCSTLMNGKRQSVDFATVDATGVAVEGAECTVTGGRKNAVDESFTTPMEGVQIRRDKSGIHVACSKEGYGDASRTVASKYEAGTAGNLVVGGLLGVGVDAVTGAMFRYPGTITMVLERLGGTVRVDAPDTPSETAAEDDLVLN